MSQGDAFFGRLVARVLFDGTEARDALDSLSGDGGAVAFEDIHELAAHVHHAGLFAGEPLAEQPVEAGEAICMHNALVALEVRGGMGALAIHAELIPGTGWGLAAPWPFIADIAPHARGLRNDAGSARSGQ